MTNKHKQKRLLNLIDFVEKLPRKRFAFSTFCSKRTDIEFRECSTAGCAAGWATTIPEFRRLGLRLEIDYNGLNQPSFNGRTGGGVLGDFFGLNTVNVMDIFYPSFDKGHSWNPTPKQWAKHARRVYLEIQKEAA